MIIMNLHHEPPKRVAIAIPYTNGFRYVSRCALAWGRNNPHRRIPLLKSEITAPEFVLNTPLHLLCARVGRRN